MARMGRRTTTSVGITLAAAAALALSGCTGGGTTDPTAVPTISATTTAAPSSEPTATPEPTPEPTPTEDLGPYPMPLFVPAEMENDDVAGAVAFMYYFVDVANYAASNNDPEALTQ